MMIREIMTQAVIGKGRLKNQATIIMDDINDIATILGCWVVNHQYEAYIQHEKLYVKGSFDINLWYSKNDAPKSEVAVKTVEYQEEVRVYTKEDVVLSNEAKLVATCPQAPVCIEAKLNEAKNVEVTIEKTILIDIVGQTKICVEVSELSETWDEIDMEIDPQFLEK